MYAKMSEILTGRSADRTLEAAQGLADTDGSAGCDLADRNRLRIMSVNIRKHGFHPFCEEIWGRGWQVRADCG